MEKSIIPHGRFCYRIKKIQKNEILSDDMEQFGKDLREYRYYGEYKQILCPYWHRTDYGTIKCEFLCVEVVDEDDFESMEKIKKYLSVSKKKIKIGYDCLLADEIKICKVNLDEGI